MGDGKEARRYLAGLDGTPTTLVLLAPLVPGVLMFTSTGLYLARGAWTGFLNSSEPRCFVAGTVIGLLGVLAAAVLLHTATRVHTMNPTAYALIENELAGLQARFHAIQHERGAPSEEDASRRAALEEVRTHLSFVDHQLQHYREHSSLRWVTGSGYVELLRREHRAEEALIDLSPSPVAAAREGIYDYLRIDGSAIPNQKALLCQIEIAVADLCPALAAKYLACSATPHDHTRAQGSADPVADELASGVLRRVRRAVNDFRDDRRDGLVRARAQLSVTVLATGSMAYLLLGVAMIESVPRKALLAAAVFFLVAGTVGMLPQLSLAARRDTVLEEDYGLAYARLIHTPLFSGLAGVFGVFLAGAVTPASNLTPLSDVYDLHQNLKGLLIAAVFGLSPNLLISRLQQQAETYKSDLKSSQIAADRPSSHP